MGAFARDFPNYFSCISEHFCYALICHQTAHALDGYCIDPPFFASGHFLPIEDGIWTYFCSENGNIQLLNYK